MPSRRYIAFLRAINVGGHIVKMDKLRNMFEALDLLNVETFIASGNVIFTASVKDTATLERRIEAHLKRALGYDVDTFIRTAEEVATVAAYEPFAPDPSMQALSVIFLRASLAPAAHDGLMACCTPTDDFHVQGREAYWLCRTRTSDSEVNGPRLAKAIGASSTVRNITTVRKLADKYG
ncbi:MAG: DUF1697 domain-containing protein [bacterium]